MTEGDILIFKNLLADISMCGYLLVLLCSLSLLVQIIRLSIVIYRSVKGRMNNV